MKLFIYLAALVYIACCLTSCQWSGVRNPNSINAKGRHIIITMHGVRGNDQTYGDFHSIIKNNLEKVDPSYVVESHNWTFPVGEKVVETKSNNGRDFVWKTHQISKKFNEDFFLGSQALYKDLGPNDKISLIAYSMGGLMAMSWYYDTMFNFAGTNLSKYSPDVHALLLKRLERVENIIGLGAVYWCSTDTEIGWSFLENGNLSEIKKALPKLNDFCSTSGAMKIIGDQSLISSASSKKEELSPKQKNGQFVKSSVLATCAAVNYFNRSDILYYTDKVPGVVLSGIKKIMTSFGNMSPYEIESMRLTSDTINEMRKGRIKHLLNNDLKNRFKAKWTSMVGVFPCLGKKDKGLTCTEFLNEDHKILNDGFVRLFSGLYRRETDGPVISPSAVADFIFYTENPGNEEASITAEQFLNTHKLQRDTEVDNKEIFIENMHATVTPALEAITGSLQSMASSAANAMKKFDTSLGVDVVIINKECAAPEKCQHPNYKHILHALGNCDSVTSGNCDQNFVNQYYRVGQSSERFVENDKLKEEMGSFVLTMNIRLPKTFQLTPEMKTNIMKHFKFNIIGKYGIGVWGERRVDDVTAPYGMQIVRKAEIASSFMTVRSYTDSQVLRVYFMGRAWAKPGQVAAAKQLLEKGVPLTFTVDLPGVKPRKVTAVVKPTYSTYVDMYMK